MVLNSGGDTTIKGAIVDAEKITGRIGGNLNIESLQDTSKFDSEQKSIGGSISVGYGKVGGSLSYSSSDINNDYASVIEQSGLWAGDGGFQIDVKGNTDLKGGAITSTQEAINTNQNQFSTAGINISDIQNHANYDANTVGVNLHWELVHLEMEEFLAHKHRWLIETKIPMKSYITLKLMANTGQNPA